MSVAPDVPRGPTWSAAFRHECEVRDCVKRFYPNGSAMKKHLEEVGKRRGQEAAMTLRDDVFEEWKRKMTEEGARANRSRPHLR